MGGPNASLRGAYLHPHLGVARLASEPIQRLLNGVDVDVVELQAEAIPSWHSLMVGRADVAQEQSPCKTVLRLDQFQADDSLWRLAPCADLDHVLSLVREGEVAQWANTANANLLDRMDGECRRSVAAAALSDDPVRDLAQVIVQVGDYISLWRVASARRPIKLAQEGGMSPVESLESVLNAPTWSDNVSCIYLTKTQGRGLISSLVRATAMVATITDRSKLDAAAAIDAALLGRLRVNAVTFMRMADTLLGEPVLAA